MVENSHAIRDIRATVSQAPQGYVINVAVLQNGVVLGGGGGILSIGPGTLTSNIVDGLNLPALLENSALTLNIVVEPTQGAGGSTNTSPGRDLTGQFVFEVASQ